MATNKERQQEFRERQKALGRSQKIFWMTHDEWEKTKNFIKSVLRSNESSKELR